MFRAESLELLARSRRPLVRTTVRSRDRDDDSHNALSISARERKKTVRAADPEDSIDPTIQARDVSHLEAIP